MNALICNVELLMLPLERQDAFLPLTSHIHLQLTSHTAFEQLLTTSQGRRTSHRLHWKSWYDRGYKSLIS